MFGRLGIACNAFWIAVCSAGCTISDDRAQVPMVRVTRLLDRPIIRPDLHPSIGKNIQGPSLIRVPEWVPAPLGKYYLYFADHKGSHIRLAYADELVASWRIHEPGALQLSRSHFLTAPPEVTTDEKKSLEKRYAASGIKLSHDFLQEITTPHIASPDVHVVDGSAGERSIRMYYHGLERAGYQVTRVAESADGIHFKAHPEVLGRTYFRAFPLRGMTYAMAMPGQFYRSADGLENFEKGPLLFNRDMRHAAMLLRGEILFVFWTRVGDTPERILLNTIDVSGDWMDWRETDAVEVLRPEHPWEGAHAPLVPSVRSTAYGQVNQLRDPAIFIEDGEIYLLYAVAGESGIAIGTVTIEEQASFKSAPG